MIALPLGWLLARVKWLRGPVLGVLGVIYTIPSLSLFVLLIPLLGLGLRTAIVALVAYAQLVLVRNILIGLTGIDPAIIEAAKGMGMNGWQRFSRVEFPLALPLILAGMRVATLSIIGIGTVAAFINGGGLGTSAVRWRDHRQSRQDRRRQHCDHAAGAGRQCDPALLRAPRGAGDPWRGAAGGGIRPVPASDRLNVQRAASDDFANL